MSNAYQEQTLAGANGVQLIVALYDAALRFLYRAIQCVEEDDVYGRRLAVKKTLDVLMYLQARLRPELGAGPATSLADFYAAMFTLTLEASHLAAASRQDSKAAFEDVIVCVRDVREAWVIAAKDPAVGRILPRELRTPEERFVPAAVTSAAPLHGTASRWSA